MKCSVPETGNLTARPDRGIQNFISGEIPGIKFRVYAEEWKVSVTVAARPQWRVPTFIKSWIDAGKHGGGCSGMC